MRRPIDLSKLSFIAGSDPAGVLDMEGRPRADNATRELLWGLDLVVLGGEDGVEVRPVRVVGEPKGIETGQPLRVEGADRVAVGDRGPPWHQFPRPCGRAGGEVSARGRGGVGGRHEYDNDGRPPAGSTDDLRSA